MASSEILDRRVLTEQDDPELLEKWETYHLNILLLFNALFQVPPEWVEHVLGKMETAVDSEQIWLDITHAPKTPFLLILYPRPPSA